MKDFVGRTKEIELMREYYESGKSELVAVYGRRRVGKTCYVHHVFDDKFFFSVTGNASLTEQANLDNFVDRLHEYGLKSQEPCRGWKDAFHMLRELIEADKRGGKKVIFFDEISWLNDRNSTFLGYFDYFWNTCLSVRDDILLIVCGSATTWITENLFENTGGLHNRFSRKIWIKPFTLAECELFFAGRGIVLSRYDIVEAYMIFGGIPYYLGLFRKAHSLSGNVDDICFSVHPPLENEFDLLYRSLFKSSELCIAIVRALAARNRGLTRAQLLEALKVPDNGHFSKALSDLTLSGFVRSYNAFPNKKKGSIFQLIDNYSLFYLNVIEGTKPTDPHYWSAAHNHPRLNTWRGCAFEMVCLLHLEQIRLALQIGAVLISVSSYSSTQEGVQIDLIIERSDRIITLCECKFSISEYIIDKETEENLRKKIGVMTKLTKGRKAVHLTMITTFGVTKNTHSGIVSSQVTMEDLFRDNR